ncbi:hypothetical protein [Candidatus Protofrankia californiensis]|uniref:hypothetical protein n=1 Tax=Candidatus Protofrankia californiensis TaxID=1839754 RepID=UPI0010418D6B|nr:hypothetical protein [Candidatus Protofrankia californiensis]
MSRRTTLLAPPVYLPLGLTARSDDPTTDATTTSPGHPVSSSTATPTTGPESVIAQYPTPAKEIRSGEGEVRTGPRRSTYVVGPAASRYEGSSRQQVLRKPAAGATIGVPTFFRHGIEGHSPALTSGATATFADVALKHQL